jgi:TPR repeat protein
VTAAEEGEPRAQFELGKRYRDGRGVPVDSVSAYTWLRLAEIHGLEDAGAARTKVAASMSADEIDRAEGLVRAWAAYFFQLTTKTLSEAELSGLRPRHYRLPPREEPGQGPATREALESGGQRERRN